MLAAAPAHALDFNFRFQDVYGSNGINGTNGFIEGTLTGLVEGNNAGPGITATVTSSPNGDGIGSGYSFYATVNFGNNAFTVTGGNISFANALFITQGNSLGLGTPGNNGYVNRLYTGSSEFADYSRVTIQFTSAATPVPFEPNSTVLIATLGFCFGAAKVRRNQLAKKRMVSVEA